MNRLSILLIGCLATTPAQALEPWGPGSGFSLSQGQGEGGLFALERSDLVVSTDPYSGLLAPSISVKKQWTNSGSWRFSTAHSLSHPALYPANGPREEGGPVSTSAGAELFSINNRFYFSKRLSSTTTLTPRVSIEYTLGSTPNSLGVDFPPLSLRNNGYHNGLSLNTGVDLDGLFTANWGYTADLEYLYLPGVDDSSALGSKASLYYQWGTQSRLLFGYQFIGGENPLGYEQRSFPTLDFIFAW